MGFWKHIGIGIVLILTVISHEKTNAQDLESLVMPGQVIAGHEELESECSSCHKTFNKAAQLGLCLDCHEDVATDIDATRGFHGLSNDVHNATCASCHTDHQGRNADIVNLDEESFDHDFTDFELIGAHLEVTCEDCHSPSEKRRDAAKACVDCHVEDDVHQDALGDNCADCHQSTDWKDADFDHDTTDYALLGKHQQVECLDCHDDETYQDAPTTCFGCHAEDDEHDGRSGNQCETCHNPSDWSDSSFSHKRDTEFPLLGRHAELTCNDCHSDDPFGDEMDTACASCHLEDDHHDGHRGDQCNDCHSNDGWKPQTFDHDVDTNYVLRGGHLDVACNDCHIEPIFEVQLVTTCESCHLDDDAHEGSLGTLCESCHTEVSWEDPVFFDHDLTTFPLLGHHVENECEDCHQTKLFGDTESSCNSCHEDDDPHNGTFDKTCESCHNPVDWEKWIFDHDAQTSFQLTGVHVEVSCNDCHRGPLDRMQSVGSTCRNCHRADDIHDGEFGFDCGRCHSADSFEEVRTLQ